LRKFLLACFLLFQFIGKGQNLVPNGDFEQYSGCPYIGTIDSALYWINPTLGSPDYLNPCDTSGIFSVPSNVFGYQIAHSGVSYVHICLFSGLPFNWREYIEVPLIATLHANSCYYFEMYVCLAETYSKFTTDDFGICFSSSPIIINTFLPLPFTPALSNSNGSYPDTSNWLLVSGNYTATGNENYLIIGNFKDNWNTDTVLYNSAVPGQWDQSSIFIDDVLLTPCTGINNENTKDYISLFPNPFSDKLNIKVKRNQLVEVNLFDVTARKIIGYSFVNSTSINAVQFAKGIYFYEIKNEKTVLRTGKLIKL